LDLTSGATVPVSFPTDSGTATPAVGALTVSGGTNINTSGAAAAVTVNLDTALTALDSATFATGGSVRTGTTATNTLLFQAYDTDTGPAYTTFATLTAGTTPTMDLSDSVTKSGQYIYRDGGTDVSVADGGSGRSSSTAYAVICGGTTSTGAHQSIASVGTSGQVLTSNGAAALPTFQASGAGTPSSMFQSNKASAANNVTGNGAVYTLSATTAVFDTGSDFNDTTSTYTAPSTAKYQFNWNAGLTSLSGAGFSETEIDTSNTRYRKNSDGAIGSPTAGSGGFSVLADMDSADTAVFKIAVFGMGGNTADIQVGTAGGNSIVNTYVSGWIVG